MGSVEAAALLMTMLGDFLHLLWPPPHLTPANKAAPPCDDEISDVIGECRIGLPQRDEKQRVPDLRYALAALEHSP